MKHLWINLICIITLAVGLFAYTVSGTLGAISDPETSGGNRATAWSSVSWNETAQSDFAKGLLTNVDIATTPGDITLAVHTRYTFAFQGGTTAFWKYDHETDGWTAMAGTPGAVNTAAGAALGYDGGNFVYAFQGGTTAFWRYDIGANTWSAMTAAPAAPGTGAALIYATDGTTPAIYATRANRSTAFWRYNIVANNWTTTLAQPGTVAGAGSGMVYLYDSGTSKYYLYLLCGKGGNIFLRYDIALNAWGSRASTAANITTGGALELGGSYLYAFCGSSQTFYRYDIGANSWLAMTAAPANTAAGASLSYDKASNSILAFQGQRGSTTCWRYDITANAWDTTSVQVAPATVTAGGAICWDGSPAGKMYAFQGGATTFWQYDMPTDTWSVLAVAPAAVGTGGALTYAGGYVYGFRGGITTAFWKYNPSTLAWATPVPAVAPVTVGQGAALAYDGSRYIYALGGNNTQNFWRYDTALDSWTTMPIITQAVNAGGALVYNNGFIYAFVGNSQQVFFRFSIAGNAWAPMGNPTSVIGTGGALTTDGTYIYGFAGGATTTFMKYTIASNTWAAAAVAPAPEGAGGALAIGDDTFIYALRGITQTTFWRYDYLNNSWHTTIAVAPGSVAAGGAMTQSVNIYYPSGKLASDVFDTGKASARWDALIWDSTLPANTGLTFEVRSSDTAFLKDDQSVGWTSVGATSPVQTGLSVGRYKQWRATLTTSLIVNTPAVQAVRTYYYAN